MRRRRYCFRSPARQGKCTKIERTKVALVYELSCKGRTVRDACREAGIEYDRLMFLLRDPKVKAIKARTLDRFKESKRYHRNARERFVRNANWERFNRQLDEWLESRGA